MTLAAKFPLKRSLRFEQYRQIVGELEECAPLVTAIVAGQMVTFHRSARREPWTITHEQIRPAYEGIGIRVAHDRPHGRPRTRVRAE